MKKRVTLIALLGAVLTLPASASEVREFMLDNGMRVFVKEDHRAPVVASMVWYKVGSSYEQVGTTGISHVLEHMMFKGTEAHAPGEFSRIIAANGGQDNAFTSRDYTAYFQRLHKDRLEISMEMEADRMRNMKVLDEEFAKEVRVVMEERRMRTEDDPDALTSEAFNAAAHVNNPYRWPVIGWMNDLENMTAADIRAWYKIWYAPNNASLVVVGDVNPEEVLELAKKHFGPLQPDTITPPKPVREAEQRGERRITVKAPAELPSLLMGYKTPVVKGSGDEWEPYALAVLSSILDDGSSSRFAKRLIRDQQIATSASAGYSPFARLDGLFMFSGQPAKGRTIPELEKAIRAEIKLVKEGLVSSDELARIKAQVIAGEVYEKDSVFYQAMQIGSLETIGLGWKVGQEYADRIKQVTAEQVREVARKYLVDDHLTVAVLDPLPLDHKKPRRPMGELLR